MNGYEKRKEQKKEAIKKAAFQLFRKHGVKEIKIEDIAQTAGVSQVTIYNHFGSKEALFREVIKEYIIEQYEFHKKQIQQKASFQEKMKSILLHKTNEFETLHPSLLKEMMINDEELKQFAEKFTQTYSFPLFMTFIKEAQEKGEINPNLSEQAIFLYIQLFNNKDLIHAVTSEGGKRLMNETFQLFFYGLSIPKK